MNPLTDEELNAIQAYAAPDNPPGLESIESDGSKCGWVYLKRREYLALRSGLERLRNAAKELKTRMVMKTYPGEPASMWCDLWEWEEFEAVLEGEE